MNKWTLYPFFKEESFPLQSWSIFFLTKGRKKLCSKTWVLLVKKKTFLHNLEYQLCQHEKPKVCMSSRRQRKENPMKKRKIDILAAATCASDYWKSVFDIFWKLDRDCLVLRLVGHDGSKQHWPAVTYIIVHTSRNKISNRTKRYVDLLVYLRLPW